MPANPPYVVVNHDRIMRLYHFLQRRGRFPIWTVYDTNTREYPGVYVARVFTTLPKAEPTRIVMTHDTLDKLREMAPPGAITIPRDESDPPQVIESWL